MNNKIWAMDFLYSKLTISTSSGLGEISMTKNQYALQMYMWSGGAEIHNYVTRVEGQYDQCTCGVEGQIHVGWRVRDMYIVYMWDGGPPRGEICTYVTSVHVMWRGRDMYM